MLLRLSRSQQLRLIPIMGLGGLSILAVLLISMLYHPSSSPPAALLPTSVIDLDEVGFARLRAEHGGRVLVVNFWATWCEPCREEFPALVRLDRAYRNRGLSLVAISMDEPESVPAIQQFLQSEGAQFGSYRHNFHDFVALVNSIDSQWGGGIPATFLYDRKGNLVRSWEGEVSYEEFERAVKPLLP